MHNCICLFIVNKSDSAVSFEILYKSLLKHSEMLRRQSHRQIKMPHRYIPTVRFQFLCNRKKRQNKETVALRFIPHIADSLSGKRPISPVIFQISSAIGGLTVCSASPDTKVWDGVLMS